MRLAQVVASVMERHADRPAIGERVKEYARDAETGRTVIRLLPRYETTSYRDLWARVRAVAGEWHHHPEHPLRAGERVAILGFTSRDYTTIDLACIHLGAVTVPLQTSAAPAQLRSILAETEPFVVATSLERLDAAVDLIRDNASVRRVVVFDYHPEADDHRESYAAARARLAETRPGVVVDSLTDLVERGTALPEAPLYAAPDGEDPLAMLIYTSGSTGTPKGAMYTERLAGAMWGGAWAKLFDESYAVTFHYMPMSHVAGHSSLKATMVRGGTSYFTASSDLSTFFEDIALARPTELSLVPRVCEMLHQRFRSEVDRRVAAGADREAAEAEVRTDIRENVLGGRVTWASCSSAPLSAELTAFTESLLGLELHNVYGSTEAAGVSVDGVLLRPPVTDYKLADVPELGYFRTDSPHPRGELLLKTDAIIPGYYKQPELTAALFDEDGYYKTGDIVAELGPDRIAIVDRRKNVLKLSQGEFVATSRLEAVFAASPLVRQIFVYGNSERSYLLAVVVPTPDAQREFGADERELKRRLSVSFQDLAKEAGLNSYEIPRDVLIETEPFSQANGLLSDHRKLLWPRLVERYGERLEQLYAETARREDEELREIRRSGANRPVLETVQRAARALLAGTAAEVSPGAHFRDLGGDSLSAVSFANLLQETFGVRVPVDMVISPAYDLRHLAEHIEARRGESADRPTFASVHGADSTEVYAKDLTLDRFIDARTLTDAAALPRPQGAPRTVLLTGASGYLGRFLALQWLEELPAGGRLIALVRGKDAEAARRRLDAAFDSGDPELVRTYEKLAADRLEVIAGDMAEPRLGLDQATWDRLADEVDLIVHAGALVNHVLPYPHLFDANVVGTAELIQLALTRRMKPVTYISSVAVATARPGQPALDEDSDVREAMPALPVDGGYAGGYAASKWAGEVLLREAHDLCGLPVTTFRSNMILAHSRYGGQLNVPDMFSRLLFSVLATGIAPRSFYRADGARAHYDGLPVDFTAAAVVALGGRDGATDEYRTFSLVNPHDDGVSLDTFVDWLTESGHRIERVEDYADWYVRFEAAMRALPEDQRQYAALPILHGFKEPEEPVPGSVIPSERFRAAVRTGGIGAHQDIPSLSRDLVAKYAADLRALARPVVGTRHEQ
ncbi:carboxylic acid reductase [Streptomyces sp. JB150]|uniref:carboxylic acid reductase n=1 Tax=Streptomyces sp. JB150 TaxID=2714844 RepID=UPI00140A773D|nr:carboxylic acid reductase [Streptomyces sp. JB150]QIJ65864.1 AMP-binding protein [Streptomyces sp. JB150]